MDTIATVIGWLLVPWLPLLVRRPSTPYPPTHLSHLSKVRTLLRANSSAVACGDLVDILGCTELNIVVEADIKVECIVEFLRDHDYRLVVQPTQDQLPCTMREIVYSDRRFAHACMCSVGVVTRRSGRYYTCDRDMYMFTSLEDTDVIITQMTLLVQAIPT